MGDTRYRGRIIWMLLTSRPDRLPVDLKRQGRAEIHIPLFYPATEDEFRADVRGHGPQERRRGRVRTRLPTSASSSASSAARTSRASCSGANRKALTDGRDAEWTATDVDGALGDFVPSAQGLEREAQELAAVLECTQLSFLPERWRSEVEKPNGRVAIQERFVAIRQILEER